MKPFRDLVVMLVLACGGSAACGGAAPTSLESEPEAEQAPLDAGECTAARPGRAPGSACLRGDAAALRAPQ
jgi:hypothetical protein